MNFTATCQSRVPLFIDGGIVVEYGPPAEVLGNPRRREDEEVPRARPPALAATGHGREDDDGVAVVDRRLQAVEDADVLVVQVDVHVAVEIAVLGEELALGVRVSVDERGRGRRPLSSPRRALGTRLRSGCGARAGSSRSRTARAGIYTAAGVGLAGRGSAEELVVGELAHLLDGDLGRVLAADRARRVAADLELGEGGPKRVVEEEATGERVRRCRR